MQIILPRLLALIAIAFPHSLGRKFEFIGKEAANDRHQRLNGS